MKVSKGVTPDMKMKLIGAGLVGLAMTALTACSNAEISEAESTAPETYKVNMTSVGEDTNPEYEIDTMLPTPSDDTFVISVEEAEAIMNKKADDDAE